MKLYIDATDNLKTLVRLDGKESVKTYAVPQDQDVLRAVLEALGRAGKEIGDISEIEVNPGPGSFTGTRVGVTIGNALAFALRIAINGQEPPLAPIYGQPPNITKSTKNK